MVKQVRTSYQYIIPFEDLIAAMGIPLKTGYTVSISGSNIVLNVDEATDVIIKDVTAQADQGVQNP